MIAQIGTLDGLGPNFYNAIWATCKYTQSLALVLVPIGIMAQVGVSILNHLIGKESQWNLSNVLGGIVVFFFIVSFQPVIKLIDGSVDLMEGYVRKKGQIPLEKTFENAADIKFNDQEAFREIKRKAEAGDTAAVTQMRNLLSKEEGFGVKKERSKPEGGGSMFNMLSLPNFVLSAVTDGITALIRVILYYMQLLLLSALIIVGPLAATISTIPIIGDNVLKQWFRVFLNFKFWGLTCAVLDILMDQYLKAGIMANYFFPMAGAVTSNFGVATIANICFIILFIMVPKITSWYTGGFSDSGASAMVGAASTIMAVGSGGATLAAAGATGGMRGAANMAGSMMGMGGGSSVQNAQMIKVFSDLNKSIGQMNKQNNNP
jgi:hypothetical protein